MSRLDLSVLGSPEVRWQGKILTFATRKALAVLLYLAVERGRHPREKITALFWPESDSDHGRAALRRTLVLLRQTLPDAEAYLLIERDQLGFNPDSDVHFDLHLLDMAVQAGPTREALTQLQSAAQAYRGDFLEGFSLEDAPDFDNWASFQREYRHRQMESIFDWLSQLHAESGETGSAIDVAARWVAHNPLNEDAHRRLMMCFFIAGNRTSALEAYEACRSWLRDELGVEPAPETQALAERIRAEVLPRKATRRQSPASTSLSDLESPFVGRAFEFSQLIEAYHTAATGHPRLVILEGEAGIGKTRLALEFLGWSRAQGAQVVRGRGFEGGERVPYQPIVEFLRQIDLQSLTTNLSPTWLSELSQLLPELQEALPELRPAATGDEATTRARLFEAVARLIQALAEKSPLILFLDDAQWADRASLDVLHYAMRFWNAHGISALLLLTHRTEPLAAPLLEWLSGIEREARSSHVILNAFTIEDTYQLIQAVAASSPDSNLQPFSQWLFAETGGQPFFMVETLRTLAERGLMAMHPTPSGGWSLDFRIAGREADLRRVAHLPHGIQAMIRARLARLTPPAQALLTAGAVLAHDFHFETLCSVAGLNEDEGLAALDELRHSHLLRESGDDPASGRLAITHEKIRDVVYEDAGQARRRVYHRRAFEIFERGIAPPGELAYHALAAGMSEAAFRFSLVAGDDALRMFAMRGAIQHFEQARTLAASLQPPISDLQSLSLKLGRAYELESDFSNARGVYAALLVSARQARQPEAECAALNRLATLAVQAAMDFETAQAQLHEAQRVGEQSGDTACLAETEWNLAQISYYLQDPISIPHGERALALARELEQPELLARSLNTLAWAKADIQGDWPLAVADAEEARVLYISLGNRAMEVDCLCLLANASLEFGQPQAAIDTARAAQAISLEIDNSWGQAHCAFQLAKFELEAGEFAEALAQAQQGASLAQAQKIPLLSLLCLNLQGTIQRSLGMFAVARETHQKTAAQFAEFPALAQPLAPMIAIELIADYASVEDWQAACAEAELLKEARLNRAPPYSLMLSLEPLMETFLRAGEVEGAAAFVHNLDEYIHSGRRSRVSYLRALALLARWQGEIEQAIPYLQEAVSLAETMGLPGEIWQIYAALGALHRQGGDEAQAQTAFGRAREMVGRLADRLDDETLRKGFLATGPVRRLLAGEQT